MLDLLKILWMLKYVLLKRRPFNTIFIVSIVSDVIFVKVRHCSTNSVILAQLLFHVFDSELTRKRNATILFPRHFWHVVLNGLIFINRYAGRHTFPALSTFLQPLLYFRSIYRRCKKCTCGSCCLTTWRLIQKSVYTCA